jgi:hypothetical protein
MTRARISASLLSLALLAAGSALAGTHFGQPGVTVDLKGRHASAYLGYARNSANTTEHAGCTISSSNGYLGVNCYAVDPNGVQGGCFSQDQATVGAFVASLGALHSDGMVWFFWNDDAECTTVITQFNSGFEPKQP